MLKRQGFCFEFEIQDDWDESRSGGSFVYQVEDIGELIVSGRIIEGIGPVDELKGIRDRLLQEAISAIQESASHPELSVRSPLSKRVSRGGLDVWVLHSETAPCDAYFSQAVICGERGLLVVTFESHKSDRFLSIFGDFIDSIRYLPASDSPGKAGGIIGASSDHSDDL